MTKKENWEKEWLEYCRTYLSRHGITNEVDILRAAGNLWEVVRSFLIEAEKNERERCGFLVKEAINNSKGSGTRVWLRNFTACVTTILNNNKEK